MNDITQLAVAKGQVVRHCNVPGFVQFRLTPIVKEHFDNERMRLTSSGEILLPDEGYWWQVMGVENAQEILEKMEDKQ